MPQQAAKSYSITIAAVLTELRMNHSTSTGYSAQARRFHAPSSLMAESPPHYEPLEKKELAKSVWQAEYIFYL